MSTNLEPEDPAQQMWVGVFDQVVQGVKMIIKSQDDERLF